MSLPDAPKSELSQRSAAEHVTGAQQILKSLREQVGQHPELDEAIIQLELALSALTLQTGGLL
jgi:hypothetical protein